MAQQLIQSAGNPILAGINTASSLAPLFLGGGTTTKKGTTTSTDSFSQKTLSDSIIAMLTGNITGGAYSKDAALSDSKGVIDAITKQLIEQNLPGISNNLKASGGYNSTATKLLTDNLAAKVAQETAKLQLDTIKNYADIQTQQANVLKGAETTGSVTKTISENSTTKPGAPIEDPMMGILGILGAGLAPSLLGSLGKAIFTSGDSASDAPPDITGKRKQNDFDVTGLGAAITDFITPTFSSTSQNNAFESIISPVFDFLNSSSPSSTNYSVGSYDSPSVFSSLANSIFSGGGGGSIVDSIGEAASNFDLFGFIGSLFD